VIRDLEDLIPGNLRILEILILRLEDLIPGHIATIRTRLAQ